MMCVALVVDANYTAGRGVGKNREDAAAKADSGRRGVEEVGSRLGIRQHSVSQSVSEDIWGPDRIE